VCQILVTKLKASLQLDPEEFETEFRAKKPAKDNESIVFYGFSSVKSTAAVEIAHKLGFKKYELFFFIRGGNCYILLCKFQYVYMVQF